MTNNAATHHAPLTRHAVAHGATLTSNAVTRGAIMANKAPAAAAPAHAHTRGTVLVVEDDPAIRAFVCATLEDDGYGVLTACDSAVAPLAAAAHPDLILLDQVMPLMDGVAVSRALKANPATAGIPIIAMSTLEPLAQVQAAMGAVDRLAKPFDLEDLHRAVEAWCRPH